MNDGTWKIFIASCGGLFGYMFGQWDGLMSLIVTFAILDYITGIIAGAYLGKLSSQVGFHGIAKKLMMFIVIACAHILDEAMGTGYIIRDSAIFFYMSNEALSVIENAGRTGLPIPDKLKQMIAVLHSGKPSNSDSSDKEDQDNQDKQN